MLPWLRAIWSIYFAGKTYFFYFIHIYLQNTNIILSILSSILFKQSFFSLFLLFLIDPTTLLNSPKYLRQSLSLYFHLHLRHLHLQLLLLILIHLLFLFLFEFDYGQWFWVCNFGSDFRQIFQLHRWWIWGSPLIAAVATSSSSTLCSSTISAFSSSSFAISVWLFIWVWYIYIYR